MNNLPFNFKSFIKDFPDGFTGCIAYHDFFSHEELLDIEKDTFETEQKCLKSIIIIIYYRTLFTNDILNILYCRENKTNEIFLWIQVHMD